VINPIDLNHYLSEEIRTAIEQRYYARINEQAQLEVACLDPEFLREPRSHTALFSDHGMVHVRDVAHQMVKVLEMIHGVLIAPRSRRRLAFMQDYGVIMAYLHDIGMVDFSKFGRAMHAEYASQNVFSLDFDPIFEAIWAENWGNMAWRLTNLSQQGHLPQPPRQVLREMLALSNCHSKSKVPIQVLNQPAALRQLMQGVVITDLRLLYHQQQFEELKNKLNQERDRERLTVQLAQTQATLAELQARGNNQNTEIGRYYHDFYAQSFQWLTASQPEVQKLVADVIDTLRVLRCADALRQRGTVLKTSGNYEVFIDQNSGHAIFALRYNPDELYLLEIEDPISAGEANIASSELDQTGNLRISFQRGQFATPAATQRAAYASAFMVNDIQLDVIDSFYGAANRAEKAPLKLAEAMQVFLEETDDNLDFVGAVLDNLAQINPEAANRVRAVPGLNQTSELERERYLRAPVIPWDIEKRSQILARIGQSGHQTNTIDPDLGFREVKLIQLEANDILVEAGAPAGFVYIPLGPGLKIIPLGGYAPFYVQPWMPLGATGVIRGAPRNATIEAETPVQLLMIPKTVYLRYWHHTYQQAQFVQRLQAKNRAI
jgi:hypothetical protein